MISHLSLTMDAERKNNEESKFQIKLNLICHDTQAQ